MLLGRAVGKGAGAACIPAPTWHVHTRASISPTWHVPTYRTRGMRRDRVHLSATLHAVSHSQSDGRVVARVLIGHGVEPNVGADAKLAQYVRDYAGAEQEQRPPANR